MVERLTPAAPPISIRQRHCSPGAQYRPVVAFFTEARNIVAGCVGSELWTEMPGARWNGGPWARMMTRRQICHTLAALAVLATPSTAFIVAPPTSARRAHSLQPQLSPALHLRTPPSGAGAVSMVRMRAHGPDSGADGVFNGFNNGFACDAGSSKFIVPGRDERWLSLPGVCVLLFNPRTENEGIYTLQLRVQDGYINSVVLFEDWEDAERYAGLLQEQDFPAPQVESLDTREIA